MERVQWKCYLAILSVAAGAMVRGQVIPTMEVKYCTRIIKRSANDILVTVTKILLIRIEIFDRFRLSLMNEIDGLPVELLVTQSLNGSLRVFDGYTAAYY